MREKDYGGPCDDNELFPRQLRRGGLDTIAISNFADRHAAYYFMAGWSEYYTPNLKSGLETAEEVNAVVLDWLSNHAGDDNFYLHINYWDTHRPYKMDESWADRMREYPVAQSWPDENTIREHQRIHGPFTATRQFEDGKSPYRLMPDGVTCRKDFEHMLTGYDASIAYVDHHIGQVLQKLKDSHMLENTAIIISGDHGDAFGEHGIYSDHVCADECIHHIPLIIKWPGLEAGRTCHSLLYNTDLPPTICDLLGYDIPGDWDGRSFKKQMESGSGEEREFLVWDHGLYAVQRAVRTHKFLMIKTYDDMGYGFDDIALYDMDNDPYQVHNIAAEEPEVLNECLSMLDRWTLAQYKKGYVENDPLLEILKERGR